MTEQTPSTGTLAIVFKIAECIINVILFTLVMVLAGGFGAMAGMLVGGPVGAVVGFLGLGIFVAWGIFALLNWISTGIVDGLRGLVEYRDGPDQPWNHEESRSVVSGPDPEPEPAVQTVAVKDAPRVRRAEVPARVETPAIREDSAVSTPGKCLSKEQVGLTTSLHVHEHGLLLYKGVIPVLVGSLPPHRARVELVKDMVGGHVIVRDADGSEFCNFGNQFMFVSRRLHGRIASAL